MSYVIQNFYFNEQKLKTTYRIKYFFWFLHVEFIFSLYRFCNYQRHLENFNRSILFYKIFKKLSLFPQSLSLYRVTIYKPSHLSNNLYLSILYWNLISILVFVKHQITIVRTLKPFDQSCYYWYPLYTSPIEINKNYYDKVIYFYFITNHLWWWTFDKNYLIKSSYLNITNMGVLNYFYNSLFFPIYSF